MKRHVGVLLGSLGLATAAHAQVLGETVYEGAVGAAGADVVGPGTDQCTDNTPYDSGNPFGYGTGRTIGGSSGWETYQPFELDDDHAICGFDLDGWYVTGSPRHFEVQLYPDDGSGDMPDLSQPLLDEPAQMELTDEAHSADWVTVDISETCIEAGTLYWLGAKKPAGSDHWSAIYRDTPFGMQAYSIRAGDFSFKVRHAPIAMRLRGEAGCDTGDCFFQTGCPADVDGNGQADVGDFFGFLDMFGDGDQCADVDESGAVDVGDFFTYLDLFSQGC